MHSILEVPAFSSSRVSRSFGTRDEAWADRAIAALGSQAGELYVEASDAAQVSPKQESSWRAVEEALEKLRMNLYAELMSR